MHSTALGLLLCLETVSCFLVLLLDFLNGESPFLMLTSIFFESRNPKEDKVKPRGTNSFKKGAVHQAQ